MINVEKTGSKHLKKEKLLEKHGNKCYNISVAKAYFISIREVMR